MTYAEVNYDIIFDHEVMLGELSKYDWLHLHHEDFTGQYGKFYKNYRNQLWYKQMEFDFQQTANSHGLGTVHNLKIIFRRAFIIYTMLECSPKS